MRERIGRMLRFSLEEYQTSLTGRIQFSALAVAISIGLFSYAFPEYEILLVVFMGALVVSSMVTSYYLYELWGEYYEKWQRYMHERSQRMKEKMIRAVRK